VREDHSVMHITALSPMTWLKPGPLERHVLQETKPAGEEHRKVRYGDRDG
jgi:hypothetical protein